MDYFAADDCVVAVVVVVDAATSAAVADEHVVDKEDVAAVDSVDAGALYAVAVVAGTFVEGDLNWG